MAYAIIRIEKRKIGAVSRIEKHHERKKDVYKSNPDIDLSRSDQNFHIKDPPDSYRKLIRKRIEEVGCRTRKDSVVMQDSICTASPEFFQGKTSRQKEDFFKLLFQRYAQDNAHYLCSYCRKRQKFLLLRTIHENRHASGEKESVCGCSSFYACCYIPHP